MTNTFRYFTQQEVNKLLDLPISTPLNIYPDELGEMFNAHLPSIFSVSNYSVSKYMFKLKPDLITLAAVHLMAYSPGLCINEIMDITFEDVYKNVSYDLSGETTSFFLYIRNRNFSCIEEIIEKQKKYDIPEQTYKILNVLWNGYTSIMKDIEGSSLKASSVIGKNENYYLFTNTKGQRLTLPAWNKRFRKYCEKAGIKLDQGATGVLNYRFHHYYIFSLIFEIEKELDCNIESLSKKEACRILSEKLNGASTTLCYDYVSYFIKNREKVEKDFGKQ